MGGSRAPRLCHAAVDHAPWLIPYAVAEAPEAEASSWNNNKDSVPPPPPPPPASAPLHPFANRAPLLIENFGMFDREEAACTNNSTRVHTLRLADAAIFFTKAWQVFFLLGRETGSKCYESWSWSKQHTMTLPYACSQACRHQRMPSQLCSLPLQPRSPPQANNFDHRMAHPPRPRVPDFRFGTCLLQEEQRW